MSSFPKRLTDVHTLSRMSSSVLTAHVLWDTTGLRYWVLVALKPAVYGAAQRKVRISRLCLWAKAGGCQELTSHSRAEGRSMGEMSVSHPGLWGPPQRMAESSWLSFSLCLSLLGYKTTLITPGSCVHSNFFSPCLFFNEKLVCSALDRQLLNTQLLPLG